MEKLKEYWRKKRVEYGFKADGYDAVIVGAAIGGAFCWAMALVALGVAAATRSWAPALWFVAGWAARSAVHQFKDNE